MNQPPLDPRATRPEDRPRPRIRVGRPVPREETAPPRRRDSNRETIESVVIAFVLAFLFRNQIIRGFADGMMKG